MVIAFKDCLKYEVSELDLLKIDALLKVSSVQRKQARRWSSRYASQLQCEDGVTLTMKSKLTHSENV